MAVNYRFTENAVQYDLQDVFVLRSNVFGNGGTLLACGNNASGELGVGNILDTSNFVQVGASSNWKYINASDATSFGIKTDGTLWATGDNVNGILGLGDHVTRSAMSQIGTMNNWSKISSGVNFSLAIKTNGTLWGWGIGSAGELGLETLQNYSSPVQIGSLTNWKEVSSGSTHTVAIKTDGTLWTWGYDAYGQLAQGQTFYISSPTQIGNLSNWKQVSAGFQHTMAIKTDGTMWAWGNAYYGQLGLGIFNEASASSPVQVGSLTNWKKVTVGQSHTVAIKTDGTLWSWGFNLNGQLGYYTDGNPYGPQSPVQVGSLTNWKDVESYLNSNLFTKTDGTLWACGYNAFGQLGLGDTDNRSSPVQVGTLNTWKSISVGANHSFAIKG